MTPKWKKGLAVLLCAAMIVSGSIAVSADEGKQLPPQTNVETGATTPDGTTPGGTTPGGTTPGGTTPGGTTPGGTTPGGTTPGGTTPGGTTPGGTTPDGTTPDGTTPGGTTPDGTTPGGTTPDETMPDGTTPDGTTPDVTPSANTGIMPIGEPSVLADTTVSSMEELKNAIDNASNGDTITLEQGTYEVGTLTIKKYINLKGNGAEIKGNICYQLPYTADSKSISVAGLSFTPGNNVQALQFRGESPNPGYNLAISVSDCAFSGYTYGVTVNSHANGYHLTVSNTSFTNIDKAMSVNIDTKTEEQKANNTLTIGSGVTLTNVAHAVETFSNDVSAANYDIKLFKTTDDYKNDTPEGSTTETDTAIVSTEKELQDALQKPGVKTIKLAANINTTTALTIPAGVTLDGDGHTLSLTGTVGNGAFVTAGKDADNVTIQNITVDVGTNAKHGIQFYCAKDGELNNVTVKGGHYTSVQVNGSEVEISNCNLQPMNKEPDKSYANIEYSMGKGVTTVPKLKISNVTGDTSGGRPLVYMDQDTVDRIIENADTNNLHGITSGSTIQEIVNALYKQGFNNADSIAVNSSNYVPEGAVPSPDPDPTPKPEDKPSSGNSSSSSGSSSSGNGGSSTPFVSMFTKKLEALKEKENASRVVLKDKKTNVTVSGEKGVLSADLKLKVTKVDEIASSLSDKLGTFLLYDIKLVDENGNTVQPKGTVTVGIPVPEGFDIDKLVVYYIDEEGNLIEYPIVVKDGVAYFETDHFSYYALAEKQGNSLTTQSTTETQTDSNKPNPSTGAQDLTAVLAAAAVSLMGLVVLGKKKR